ncbi:MAG TPA: hypothetical protein VL357_07560 [Rariglobus sp.]|jgi:hypothetical protein|nr:hypothetical protein [Rariglobus sp.]
MNQAKSPLLRPRLVTIAVLLMLVSVTAALFKLGLSVKRPPVIGILIGLSIPVANAWFIYFGKNWARWVFIILFGGGLLMSPWMIPRSMTSPEFSLTLYWLQAVIQLGAAILLLLPESNTWFRKGRNRPNQEV